MKNVASCIACAGAVLLSPPAMARDSHVEAVEHAIHSPSGVSATMGIRVPLGSAETVRKETTFGVTVRYGMRIEESDPFEVTRTRQVELAQLNFDHRGARDVQLANYSLTQFGRDVLDPNKLNLSTGETVLVVGGGIAAALLVVWLAADDDDINFFE